MSINITDKNFKEEILNQSAEKLLVIDFFAQWCGPCKTLSPKIDELKKDYEGKVNIVKINVDENPEIASKYGIRSIPTILFFEKGEKKTVLMGATKSKIEEEINKMIG